MLNGRLLFVIMTGLVTWCWFGLYLSGFMVTADERLQKHLFIPSLPVQDAVIVTPTETDYAEAISHEQVGFLFVALMIIGLVLGHTVRVGQLTLAALVLVIGYLLMAVALANTGILLPILHSLFLIGSIFGLDVLYRYKDSKHIASVDVLGEDK